MPSHAHISPIQSNQPHQFLVFGINGFDQINTQVKMNGKDVHRSKNLFLIIVNVNRHRFVIYPVFLLELLCAASMMELSRLYASLNLPLTLPITMHGIKLFVQQKVKLHIFQIYKKRCHPQKGIQKYSQKQPQPIHQCALICVALKRSRALDEIQTWAAIPTGHCVDQGR